MRKKITNLFICLVFLCGMFLSNTSTASAETIIGTKEGGTGKGYAQCAYTWIEENGTVNQSTSAPAHYRLITKVWGTTDNNKNVLKWNYNLVTASKNSQDSHYTNNQPIVRTDLFEKFYLSSSNSFTCPAFVCYQKSGTKYNWQFVSKAEEDFYKGCPTGYTKANKDSTWTKIENNKSTNGDINASSLYNVVSKIKSCSCFYKAENKSTDVTDIYYYKVDFTENSTSVGYGKRTSNAYTNSTTVMSDWLEGIIHATPFKINSANIVSKDCTIKACNSANIRYANGTPQVLIACDKNCSKNTNLCGGVCNSSDQETWSKGTKLTAITANQYDSVKKGEDADPNISSSTGISDVTLEEIIKWGDKDTSNSLYGDDGEINPCSIIDDDLKDLLNKVLLVISVAGIIMLIVMSMIEFVKAVTGANDDLIKTALKHTIIRIICAIILFLLPMIVSGIINIINNANGPVTDANGNVIMGEDGNPLCGVGE